MTTDTPSQAASIDTPEFDDLLLTYWECRNQGESYAANERAELIAYIDTKLAEARSEGVNAANDFRALVSDSDTAEIKEWKARATAAESRLAEIQRGVEGLLQYIADHDWGGIPEPVPQIDALRILLQPQGQADTSGLPG